jgi:hypothetical protein
MLGGWMKNNLKRSQNKKISLILIFGLFVSIAFFQNCTNKISVSDQLEKSLSSVTPESVDPTDPNPSGDPTQILDVATITEAHARLNEDVEFVLNATDISLRINQDLVVTNHENFGFTSGRLEIINLRSRLVLYRPNVGFRGTDSGNIFVVDKFGNKINYKINISVENAVKKYEPAAAIRAIGCIQCHAKVESNMITDFGLGNSYFFSKNLGGDWWKNGGVYGDHGQNIRTMELANEISIIVPKADLPQVVKNSTYLQTVADYVKSEVLQSQFENTRNANVAAKERVYIGAPTEQSIRQSFALSVDVSLKYYKESSESEALTGLVRENGFFRNTNVLTCEGDLAIEGPLYLENLKVKSRSGCRIYVIGSAFIFGSIEYVDETSETNLQITSTKAISMGLGLTKKNGAFCDPDSRYATDPGGYNVSSLVNRFKTFWTVPSYSTRQVADPMVFGQSIINESKAIELQLGSFMDADCRAEGKNINFKRLLLNAPQLQSRYEGNFSGVIIAEIAIMRLGDFKFKYDPVFKNVPILPFINQGDLLTVSAE